MAASLVVASAPVTKYPGGVRAVRAADWTDRTTGSDALASTGTYVSETQTVDSASFSYDLENPDVYALATDTLVIPVADIHLQSGYDYDVYVTYRLVGEWDPENSDTLGISERTRWMDIVAMGIHGTDSETEEFPYIDNRMLGHLPHYNHAVLFVSAVDSSMTLHIRAYSMETATVEVRIDQVVFIPYWDHRRDVAGNATSFDFPVEDEDGGDGGDTYGERTYEPVAFYSDAIFPSGVAGDYQRKSDSASAEWDLQMGPDNDAQFLYKDTSTPISAHAYSLHNVSYDDFSTEDTFDNRTTSPGQDMGISADGYGYRIGFPGAANEPYAYVDGGVGILRLRQSNTSIEVEWGSAADQTPNSPVQNYGAALVMNDGLAWSGVLQNTAGALPSGNRAWRFYIASRTVIGLPYIIYFNTLTKEWQLVENIGPAGHPDNDISGVQSVSWYSPGTLLGFRFEIRRYVIRVRFWDAGGAEPSTWDYEDFRPINEEDYPYSTSSAEYGSAYFGFSNFGIHILGNSSGGLTLPYDVTIHSLKMEHLAGGDPDDMTIYLESPKGTPIDEIVVPYGCPHFVYWGQQIWTEPSVSFSSLPTLSFSTKMWNHDGAAELQRAQTYRWFFGVNDFSGVMSMNWSGKNKAGAKGVLG